VSYPDANESCQQDKVLQRKFVIPKVELTSGQMFIPGLKVVIMLCLNFANGVVLSCTFRTNLCLNFALL